MRNSLENIELVDNYLNGKLNAEEKAEFTKNLENNAELQQLLETQKDLMQAIQRKALRTEINQVSKWNTGGNNINNWLLGGIILIIAGGLFLFFFGKSSTELHNAATVSHNGTPSATTVKLEDSSAQQNNSVIVNNAISNTSKPQTDSEISFNGLNTWVKPFVQIFQVNPSKGATIEGKDGTLVIIPTDAFIDKNNKPVTDLVQFEMVEALTLEDMVLYNLGTTADGKALETGGMLHFNFTCSGKEIKINPKRPLYVEVPTDEVKKGMVVFEGEVTNKKVNWKNPKPLKKYLVNVDFSLLDFLPKGFADTVKTILPFKGHAVTSQQLVDSLYYSLLLKKETKTDKKEEFESKSIVVDESGKRREMAAAPVAISTSTNQKIISSPICSGIDPLAIKTIKTEPYSKTFIATKEFAERVIELHELEKGNELLKLYIDNLNENLSHVDSMVVRKLVNNKTFGAFAAEGLTNIKDAQIYQDKLSAYYNKKYKEYKISAENLQQELDKKNEVELRQLIKNYTDYLKLVQARRDAVNPPALASQLPSRNVATGASYSFQWAAPGWVNIDCYLHLLDGGSEEVNMAVNNAEGTTEVYQWLNTINNLTPLIQNEQTVKALFPIRSSRYANDMKNTFCFAISRNNGQYKWFDLRYNPYETKNINIILAPSTLPEIRKQLRMYNVSNDLEERLNKVEEMAIKIEKERIVRLDEMRKSAEQIKLIGIKIEQMRRENQIIDKLRSAAFLCNTAVVEKWIR